MFLALPFEELPVIVPFLFLFVFFNFVLMLLISRWKRRQNQILASLQVKAREKRHNSERKTYSSDMGAIIDPRRRFQSLAVTFAGDDLSVRLTHGAAPGQRVAACDRFGDS